MDCGSTCSTTFNYGTEVTLSAAPDSNIIFNGWSGGGCSGTGTCAVALTANTIITSDFEAPRISVAPSSNDFGNENMGQTSAAQPFIVTNSGAAPLSISGVALQGPNTTDFSVTADACTNATLQANGACEIDVVFNPATAGVKFAEITVTSNDPSNPSFNIALNGTGVQVYTLTLNKLGNGSGGVSSLPVGIDCGSTCSSFFATGTQVVLTASPDASSAFAGWSGGGCSGTGTCTAPVSADTAVSANFVLTTFTVTPLAGSGGSLSPATPQTVNYNATTSFTVTPSTGYKIESVTGCGGTLSGNTFTEHAPLSC